MWNLVKTLTWECIDHLVGTWPHSELQCWQMKWLNSLHNWEFSLWNLLLQNWSKYSCDMFRGLLLVTQFKNTTQTVEGTSLLSPCSCNKESLNLIHFIHIYIYRLHWNSLCHWLNLISLPTLHEGILRIIRINLLNIAIKEMHKKRWCNQRCI